MKYYLTTPIYYVNNIATVGTAYTSIACDALARYHRMRGDDVLFTTGTDEHAVRVLRLAEEKGVTPQAWADPIVAQFKEDWRLLDISYDDFLRTPEPRQHRAVQRLFQTIYENGDLYLGSYEGWYCVPDETFFAEEDLLDGKCPNPECGRPVEWVSEPAYFFRFSKYQEPLLRYIEEHPDWLLPEFRKNEVVSFLKSGLRDVSISRRSPWGIPLPSSLPESEGLVVYVWADALVNYLTCAGYPDDQEKLAHYWPADLHLMAKDIFTRFHATLWPAMLLSAGLPLPKQEAAHGYWTVGGEKISKSRSEKPPRPQAVVDQVVAETGCTPERAVDALRYYELREMTFGQDADFSLKGLLRRYNDDLGNDLGNLLHRVLTMIGRYRDGVLPPACPPEPELLDAARAAAEGWDQSLQTLQFSDALKAIWAFLGVANKYVDQQAPWSLAKAGDNAALDRVLYSAAESLRLAAVLLAPVMPNTAAAIETQLGLTNWTRTWEQATQWGLLPGNQPTGEPTPLFPKLEPVKHNKPKTAPAKPETKAPSPEPRGPSPEDKKPLITIQDFLNLDLRVAEILTAEPVPGANKLLKLTIDLGAEQRTLVAGIALAYKPEDLPGKKIVVVANLEPATLRGVRSEGMLLAGSVPGDDTTIALLTPEKALPNGAKVK